MEGSGGRIGFANPEDFSRLRSALAAAEYTDAGVLGVLRVKDFPSIRERDLPLLLRCTDRGTPLDTLIRLFLIEVPVSEGEFRRAIHPMDLETWVEGGLVQTEGGSVSAGVKLIPFQDLLLAFDLDRRLSSPLSRDYVMGIGRSSLTLANITVRRPARLTLDLGTGCGFQALLAARHSDRVLAVDRNPRAVQMAAFNARLNGFSNVECLEGDLFEPVRGLGFDLIVSNPPFVISPEARYLYRDGGMEGDDLCRRIVREAPGFLAEGGFCQILCNWAEPSGQQWQERLKGWFDGTGCDAWVMRSETRDVAAYASTWIRHTERSEPEEYPRRFAEWMDYYQRRGIEGVGAGLITLRRSAGRRNWVRAEEGPDRAVGPGGEYILRGFELRDFLEAGNEDALLLQAAYRASPDLCLERRSKPSAEGWKEVSASIRLEKGLAYQGSVDPFMANLIMGCDGRRALGGLMNEMAVSLGLDPEKIRPAFCGLARRLVEQGFLLPAHFDG